MEDHQARMAVLERDLAALDRLVHSQMSGHNREHELLMQGVEEFKDYLKSKLQEMNEVRSQINSERGHFASNSTVEAKLDAARAEIISVDHALRGRVTAVEVALSNYQGRLWMLGLTLSGLIFVLKIFWK